jgi:hypothetical protein
MRHREDQRPIVYSAFGSRVCRIDAMRLTSDRQIIAREELLARLKSTPNGLSTNQLRGTNHFHGEKTLSAKQVVRLLRRTGQAEEYCSGAGVRAFTLWKFSTAIPTNAGEIIHSQLEDFLKSKPRSLNSPDGRHEMAFIAVRARAKAWSISLSPEQRATMRNKVIVPSDAIHALEEVGCGIS